MRGVKIKWNCFLEKHPFICGSICLLCMYYYKVPKRTNRQSCCVKASVWGTPRSLHSRVDPPRARILRPICRVFAPHPTLSQYSATKVHPKTVVSPPNQLATFPTKSCRLEVLIIIVPVAKFSSLSLPPCQWTDAGKQWWIYKSMVLFSRLLQNVK